MRPSPIHDKMTPVSNQIASQRLVILHTQMGEAIAVNVDWIMHFNSCKLHPSEKTGTCIAMGHSSPLEVAEPFEEVVELVRQGRIHCWKGRPVHW